MEKNRIILLQRLDEKFTKETAEQAFRNGRQGFVDFDGIECVVYCREYVDGVEIELSFNDYSNSVTFIK